MAMSREERDWLEWLKRVQDGMITQRHAAEKMGVSDRWVRRLRASSKSLLLMSCSLKKTGGGPSRDQVLVWPFELTSTMSWMWGFRQSMFGGPDRLCRRKRLGEHYCKGENEGNSSAL
jgi:hypothetical protein